MKASVVDMLLYGNNFSHPMKRYVLLLYLSYFILPYGGGLDLCVNIYSPQIQIYKILHMSKKYILEQKINSND